ncbi:hypothetical protein OEZ86_008404 [Tetradesmus obliquus]|nr:hypothetical protein OEZ86_008404 [Tetradesmus obliquus]
MQTQQRKRDVEDFNSVKTPRGRGALHTEADDVLLGSAAAAGPEQQHGARRLLAKARRFVKLAVDVVTCTEDVPDGKDRTERWCPEEGANWLSQLFFAYANSLVRLGGRKHLEQADLWDTAHRDEPPKLWSSFQRHLAATATAASPQGLVWRALAAEHWRVFASTGLLKLVHDCIMFSQPIILEQLLHHLSSQRDRWVALGLAGALFGAAMLEALLVNVYFHALFRMSLHTKTQLLEMIYRKSLRVSSAVKAALGVGPIVNLQSNDAAKLWTMPTYLHMVWNGPFQIIVVMALLIRVLTVWPALAGLGVTIAIIPTTMLLGKLLTSARRESMAAADMRIKLMTEVITGIKAIKLYAWEAPYLERISALRETELRAIRKTQMLSMINSSIFNVGPVFVGLAAFGTYAALGLPLTAAVAFPSLALFNLLRFPIVMIPQQIMNLIAATVGIARIQKFMDAEDMHSVKRIELPHTTSSGKDDLSKSESNAAIPPVNGSSIVNSSSSSSSSSDVPAVQISNGSFAWDASSAPVLSDVSLVVPKGSLVIVVGPVGSGKSSLLSAVLGEMAAVGQQQQEVEEGQQQQHPVTVAGSVAYTAQDPWIQNATLRNNVLMGHSFEQGAYERAIHASCLGQDLEILPAGDASEIGEKGINLSGGQKHRVALARAVYAAADVYLLDDPLSAVDVHVGRHIFEDCICGELAGKTRLLVTHQVQYLPHADLVVVMLDGRIAHTGTYEQLLSQGVDLAAFHGSSGVGSSNTTDDVDDVAEAAALVLTKQQQQTAAAASPGGKQQQQQVQADISVHSDQQSRTGAASAAGGDGKEGAKSGKLIRAEERARGQVRSSVYMAYLLAMGPLLLLPIAVTLGALVERGLQVLQNYVLSAWSNATSKVHGAAGEPLGGHSEQFYLMLYFVLGLGSAAVVLARSALLVVGSISASRQLHERLLTKMLRLPMSFYDAQPTGRLINRFTKDTEALDIQMAAAVNSALTCLVGALLSIVVVVVVSPYTVLALIPLGLLYYRVQRLYIATSRELKRLDALAFSPIFQHYGESLAGLATIRAFDRQQLFIETNRGHIEQSNRAWWPIQLLNRWLSIRLELTGAVVVFICAVAVSVLVPRNAGLAGLALTSALNLTGTLAWMVRQTTELEVNMNSVERLVEYHSEPEEKPAISHPRPPPEWPQAGAIEAVQLVVRYRPALPPVLKGLSFKVKANEKVGICGRTGCGKSTLMMVLFRMVEPCGGALLIDGLNTCDVGLTDLRSRLSLVPQDPVIFSGSVRSNLDPFDQAGGDAAIWQALRQAGIDGLVKSLGAGLDSPIQEAGNNLSSGQRQLLCMARALLRSSRILVLDEATSNVDHASDALIQRTIRRAFAHCTVLTIAHRLHTIADADRVMVLDAGELREFDSPAKLLARPAGVFRGLMEEAGRQHRTPARA